MPQIVIKHNKAREIFWNNRTLPTNVEIELSWSDTLKLSRLFSLDIRNNIVPSYNSEHWKNKRYGFTGDADTASGFGNCTVNLVRQSLKNGYDVRWLGRHTNIPDFRHLSTLEIPTDIGMVWHEQPKHEWLDTPFGRNIAIVPFETTQIPLSWVKRINSFDALFVPCRQNIEMMQNSGINIPIELIHWGVDPNLFYPLKREDKDIFTFGTMGALSVRKGTDILVKAFDLAFPSKNFKDVRLLCKTSYSTYMFGSKDPRIKVDMLAVDNEELMKSFFGQINCFIFPTRGEGAGLPPIEAMATGVPAIVTNWSGPVDYMTPEIGWTIDYKMVPAKNFTEQIYKEDCGNWAEPSIDDLVEKMRYAYYHRDEVKSKGIAAGEHIKNNWTWDKQIGLYFDALNRHLS